MNTEYSEIAHQAPGGETERPVAWEIEINCMSCIVFAVSAPKAKWIAVKGYWEAGYGREGQWPTTKHKRIPIYDMSILATKKQRAWTPEYVRSMT